MIPKLNFTRIPARRMRIFFMRANEASKSRDHPRGNRGNKADVRLPPLRVCQLIGPFFRVSVGEMHSIGFPFGWRRNGPFLGRFGALSDGALTCEARKGGRFCPPGAKLAPRTHRLVFARALRGCLFFAFQGWKDVPPGFRSAGVETALFWAVLGPYPWAHRGTFSRARGDALSHARFPCAQRRIG